MTNVKNVVIGGVTYPIEDTTARTTKLDIHLGVEYSNKFLKVGDDGNIMPFALSPQYISETSTLQFLVPDPTHYDPETKTLEV